MSLVFKKSSSSYSSNSASRCLKKKSSSPCICTYNSSRTDLKDDSDADGEEFLDIVFYRDVFLSALVFQKSSLDFSSYSSKIDVKEDWMPR